jgi:hypothetical protein
MLETPALSIPNSAFCIHMRTTSRNHDHFRVLSYRLGSGMSRAGGRDQESSHGADQQSNQ